MVRKEVPLEFKDQPNLLSFIPTGRTLYLLTLNNEWNLNFKMLVSHGYDGLKLPLAAEVDFNEG